MQLKKAPEDYREDVNSTYDFENQLTNIVEMHELIEKNKLRRDDDEIRVQPTANVRSSASDTNSGKKSQ
jgi:hypothetical protein